VTTAAHRGRQHLPHRAVNFHGRGQELDDLAERVRVAARGGGSLGIVGIKGMGGVGKTTLVAELAERLWQDARLFPGGVLWANLQEEGTADAARRWVADLGGDARDLDPQQTLQRFHQLAAACRPLVVLDNVPKPGPANPAEQLLGRAAGVVTLLTTRFREAVPDGVRVEELDALSTEDARELLRSHVGPVADADPAGDEVLQLCERLPLFVNVAGRAVANGYFSLAGYAEELRRRGLAALSDEDQLGKAAAVFEPSWLHLSQEAREAFAVLALAPGDDVGTNLLRAWLAQAGGETAPHRSVRVLADLANASLLTRVEGRSDRFRYHDRVRDYALSKLPLLPLAEAEVRRRLLACWCDWDFVREEFASAGAYGLAGQYLRLRTWGVEEPADFGPWFHFARGQASVLGQHPELFFQQAANEPADSPVSRAGLVRRGTKEEPERWLEWVNRPRQWVPPACLMVLRGHAGRVWAVALSADGRTAVSGSDDNTVRSWDLSTGRCTAVLEGHAGWVNAVALSADGRTAVSGSYDKTVRSWDLTTGRCTVLEGHPVGFWAVAVGGA
jgi:hypothetical protein